MPPLAQNRFEIFSGSHEAAVRPGHHPPSPQKDTAFSLDL